LGSHAPLSGQASAKSRTAATSLAWITKLTGFFTVDPLGGWRMRTQGPEGMSAPASFGARLSGRRKSGLPHTSPRIRDSSLQLDVTSRRSSASLIRLLSRGAGSRR